VVLLAIEEEDHAVVWRKGGAIHEPARLSIGRIRDLDEDSDGATGPRLKDHCGPAVVARSRERGRQGNGNKRWLQRGAS
jgi:hypothetical protein